MEKEIQRPTSGTRPPHCDELIPTTEESTEPDTSTFPHPKMEDSLNLISSSYNIKPSQASSNVTALDSFIQNGATIQTPQGREMSMNLFENPVYPHSRLRSPALFQSPPLFQSPLRSHDSRIIPSLQHCGPTKTTPKGDSLILTPVNQTQALRAGPSSSGSHHSFQSAKSAPHSRHNGQRNDPRTPRSGGSLGRPRALSQTPRTSPSLFHRTPQSVKSVLDIYPRLPLQYNQTEIERAESTSDAVLQQVTSLGKPAPPFPTNRPLSLKGRLDSVDQKEDGHLCPRQNEGTAPREDSSELSLSSFRFREGWKSPVPIPGARVREHVYERRSPQIRGRIRGLRYSPTPPIPLYQRPDIDNQQSQSAFGQAINSVRSENLLSEIGRFSYSGLHLDNQDQATQPGDYSVSNQQQYSRPRFPHNQLPPGKRNQGDLRNAPISTEDDLLEINMSDALTTIQNRRISETPTGFNDQDVTIKVEISSDLPANPPRRIAPPEKLIAAQRSLLGKVKRNPVLTNSLTLPTQPPPEISKKRRRESLVDERVPIETVMNADQEDNTWMDDEVDDDDDSDSMRAELATLRRRQANGKINNHEQVRLMKLENDLQLKQRLRNAAGQAPREDLDEDSLFVPETDHEFVRRHRRGVPGRDQSPDGETPRSSEPDEYESETEATLAQMLNQHFEDQPVKKSRKPRKKAAKNAREYYAKEQSSRIERERSKSQKKKAREEVNGGLKKKSAKAKPAKKGKARKGKKGGVKAVPDRQWVSFGDGQDVIGQRILDDLMNNDPISERLQDPIFNLGPEPAIEGGVSKATQLQRLLAHIPEGSDAQKGRGDKVRLLKASKSFGYANVKGVEGKWLVKGMISTLYHHQLLGAQWMVERELSSEPPHGGLLADGMGLGKTVQTLACMVGNPPGQEDLKRGVKATLIVVPSAVIDQWLDEVRVHVKEKIFPKIMRYKTSSNIPLSVLEDLDIVVTSYHEVMRQFPYPDREAKLEITRIGYKRWWSEARTRLGPLHQVDWYRVVLDEAHSIKNNNSKTSLACQNLKSVFRWCLTGTPLLNRLEELFPYLRFLRANYSMDWVTFQRHFCDPDADDCHKRITTLLSYSMMRRSMKTTILGRPIITLPPPHPEVKFIDFSAEEKIIYRITENRFRSNLNTFFANGTAQRAYGLFFVQLLRLRQCTSHPFMLERTMRDSWTSEDVAELKRKLKKLSKTTIPFYEQCKQWVTKSVEEREAAAAVAAATRDHNGMETSPALEAMPFGTSDFGERFQLNKALDTLDDKTLFERITCRICTDIPIQPVITDCSHIFCNDCLTNHLHQRAAEEDDDLMVCPHCDCFFASSQPYKDIFVDDDDQIDSSRGSQGSNSKRKRSGSKEGIRRGGDALGFEPSTKDSTWVAMSDHENFPLTPSAKTTALKAILLQGFHEAPTDKVVIYVQFRTLARIVGRMCEREGWGFLYLTGDSSLEHRTKATRKFRDDPGIKILIAGLKCGGLGLNFPWANRCISLDLWWNHAVEQQAFGRIFRIGQNKETYMTRIVVRHSVDERLFQMQHHKLKTCEKAMNDGEGRPPPNLGLAELASLFGFLKTDEGGNIERVDADYDDAEEFEAKFGGGSEDRDGEEMYE